MRGQQFSVKGIQRRTGRCGLGQNIRAVGVLLNPTCGRATVTGADGKIELNKNAKVTITNEIKKLDEPEAPFIEVTKTFVGLTKAQVKELALANPPYQITVTNGNDSRTLKMETNDTEFNKNLTGEDTTWRI